MNFLRIVGEFWENNCKENFRIFRVNFENINILSKSFKGTSHKFWKYFRTLLKEKLIEM